MTKAKPIEKGRSVTVACKVPTGLQLRLQTKQPRVVDTPQGPKMVDFWVAKPGSRPIFVHGPAYPVSAPPGYPKPPLMAGGYALTPGVPIEHWNEWLEQNALADYVTSDMIYALPSVEDAVSWSEERGEILSGMEPLSQEVDPKTGRLKDPRVPRPLSAGLAHLGKEPHPNATGGEASITQPA